MSRKNNTVVNEEWFINKGYSWNEKTRQWEPPKMKSNFIQGLQKKQHLYVNEDIIEKTPKIKTPEFTHVPKAEWTITGQIPSKKNSRLNFVKNGKQISIPSKSYTEYKKLTKTQWEVFGREFRQAVTYYELEFPLKVEITFTRKTRQRFDYFGPGESVADLMVDYKWIPDDDTKHFKPFFGDALVDKDNAGTKIKLLIK